MTCKRGAVAAVGGFGEIGFDLDRHLFLVGTVGEGLAQRPSVEAAEVTSPSRFISANNVGARSTLLDGVRTVPPA